jgi:uridylate kinase
MDKPLYKRVMLKISGEALAEPNQFGINLHRTENLAKKIKDVHDLGVQLAIVIGGGNIWRGVQGIANGMEKETADHIGMLGTVMNCLALSDALKRNGKIVRFHTSVPMKEIAEPYVRLRALHQMEKGYIIILGAGTGHPYFTTDTAAALRGAELNSDIFIKATNVDFLYAEDPKKNPEAKPIKKISYMDFLKNRLGVMDSTAVTLCMNNHLPIKIINLWKENSLKRALTEENFGSMIYDA